MWIAKKGSEWENKSVFVKNKEGTERIGLSDFGELHLNGNYNNDPCPEYLEEIGFENVPARVPVGKRKPKGKPGAKDSKPATDGEDSGED